MLDTESRCLADTREQLEGTISSQASKVNFAASLQRSLDFLYEVRDVSGGTLVPVACEFQAVQDRKEQQAVTT
jgi:hypothetical protein